MHEAALATLDKEKLELKKTFSADKCKSAQQNLEDTEAKKRTAQEAANVYTDVKDFSEVERIQIFLNQMVSTFGKVQVAIEVQYSK